MHVHLCIFQCLLCKPVNYVQFILTQDLEIRRNRNRVPLGREKNNLSGKSHVVILVRG